MFIYYELIMVLGMHFTKKHNITYKITKSAIFNKTLVWGLVFLDILSYLPCPFVLNSSNSASNTKIFLQSLEILASSQTAWSVTPGTSKRKIKVTWWHLTLLCILQGGYLLLVYTYLTQNGTRINNDYYGKPFILVS